MADKVSMYFGKGPRRTGLHLVVEPHERRNAYVGRMRFRNVQFGELWDGRYQVAFGNVGLLLRAYRSYLGLKPSQPVCAVSAEHVGTTSKGI